MENEELLPKEQSGDDLPPVVDPDENGQCPTGYYYDKETDKCILDVGE